MTAPILMPTMTAAQTQSWRALMSLYEKVPSGWTLVGGQLVHLHCAERGASPVRPTEDADTVVDVRSDPTMLRKFTEALAADGFAPVTTGDGLQHRWLSGQAQIDVLLPEGIGERSAARIGVGGAPTLSAPGTTQALARSEAVAVSVDGRVGTILRPTLFAALVGKAAARHGIAVNAASQRHCTDFVVLATLLAAADFRNLDVTRKDRARLRKMVATCRADVRLMVLDGAEEGIDRLVRGAGL